MRAAFALLVNAAQMTKDDVRHFSFSNDIVRQYKKKQRYSPLIYSASAADVMLRHLPRFDMLRFDYFTFRH